jgi:hypothetical protein
MQLTPVVLGGRKIIIHNRIEDLREDLIMGRIIIQLGKIDSTSIVDPDNRYEPTLARRRNCQDYLERETRSRGFGAGHRERRPTNSAGQIS